MKRRKTNTSKCAAEYAVKGDLLCFDSPQGIVYEVLTDAETKDAETGLRIRMTRDPLGLMADWSEKTVSLPSQKAVFVLGNLARARELISLYSRNGSAAGDSQSSTAPSPAPTTKTAKEGRNER